MFVSLGKNNNNMPRGWASTSHKVTRVALTQRFEGRIVFYPLFGK